MTTNKMDKLVKLLRNENLNALEGNLRVILDKIEEIALELINETYELIDENKELKNEIKRVKKPAGKGMPNQYDLNEVAKIRRKLNR